MRKLVNSITFLLVALLLVSSVPFLVSNSEVSASDDNTFSIMQISDTQHLATINPALYNDTASWIVNNSASYNLKMVIHTGDFIDAFYAPPVTAYNASQKDQEWAVANASIGKLLAASVPYCWCAGNHDQIPYGNSSGTIGSGSNYLAFNASYMRSKSYWVDSIFDSKNTAVNFSFSNYYFLVIDIENLANSSTIDWMKSLLDRNAGANVIVATHDYLYPDGTYDAATAAVGNWTLNLKTTLDNYPNVFLALCGHNHGVNMTKTGNRNEILFDFQESNNMTGAASVRIYTFDLSSKKMNATTYSLDTKTWIIDDYDQFSLNVTLQQTINPTQTPTPTATSAPTSFPTSVTTQTPTPTSTPTRAPTPFPTNTTTPTASAPTPSSTLSSTGSTLSTEVFYVAIGAIAIVIVVAIVLLLRKRK